MSYLDRDEVENRLMALDDPWLSAAFSARITALVLPALAIGVEKGKLFLWFWPEEVRKKYLILVLRAWQCGWSASRFRDSDMSLAAAEVGDAANDGVTYAAKDASCAYAAVDTAINAAYAAYAADVVYASASAYAFTEAVHFVADSADTAYDANLSAEKIFEDLILLEKLQYVGPYLDRSFGNIGESKDVFLLQLRKWENDGFDYWADWYESRLSGDPLDEQLTKSSCLLSKEILSQSPKAINFYLKSLSDKSASIPLNRVRAIFIGFGAAGKTSLIRVLHGESVVEGEEKMTPGIEIRDWQVPETKASDSEKTIDADEEMVAHLWDFGGQVMAHATHQFFLRSRCLYVLGLDGRTEINANEQAEYWLEHIRAFGGNAPVLLVGNKADQVQVNLDMNYLREKYPNIVDFYPVSCTKCHDNFKAEFERFRRDFIKQLRVVGMHRIMFTKRHFAVLESVRDLSPKQTFLPKDTYEALCRENAIEENGDLDQRWLLDLLDKLGVIIHFPSLPWLSSYLLNPRWLTYGVYTLFYAKQAQRLQGCLTAQAVIDILRAESVTDNLGNTLSYPPENCRFIMDALKQFEIGFRMEDKAQTLLIPALLPSDTPKHGFDKTDALAFDFDFTGFLPRHVTPGFIVRRHQEIADGMVWQNGVRLRSRSLDAEALAQADYHERRLSLWVRGSQAGRYFSALHDEVMQMLARMPDLRYKEWVCLPGGNKDQRAGFRQLLAMEAAGERRYICEYGVFDLSEVLKIMPPDKRETNVFNYGQIINKTIRGDQMGDNIHIHDIKDSLVNVKSSIDKAMQLVKTLPRTSPEEQNKLENLLTQLHEQLIQVPEDKAEDARNVADYTEELLEKAKKEKPPSQLQISAKGLKEAAGALANVVPQLLPLVEQITKTIL